MACCFRAKANYTVTVAPALTRIAPQTRCAVLYIRLPALRDGNVFGSITSILIQVQCPLQIKGMGA